MNILFVCKYNRFRSRVAEAYFKKINKDESINASSGGIIKGFLPLDKDEVRVAKNFGISILGKPRALSVELLKSQDKIIVVANDVPKKVFSYGAYKNKVEIWKIPDANEGKTQDKRLSEIIEKIIKKVDNLNKELK